MIVNVKVVEGERTRVQAYEGVCIGRSGGGLNESFTVRKISYGEGVERVFPLYSPMIDSIKLVRRGKVRRAKLYYLRDLRGKSARIAEGTHHAGQTTDVEADAQRNKAGLAPFAFACKRPACPAFLHCRGSCTRRMRGAGNCRTFSPRARDDLNKHAIAPERVTGYRSWPSRARSTTRSGTTIWSTSSRTAPACSTSTGTSSMR